MSVGEDWGGGDQQERQWIVGVGAACKLDVEKHTQSEKAHHDSIQPWRGRSKQKDPGNSSAAPPQIKSWARAAGLALFMNNANS